jgi:hypothetical protein
MGKLLTLRNPVWLIALVAVVAVALAFAGGGIADFFTGGGLAQLRVTAAFFTQTTLAQVITFVIALACALAAVRLAMFLNLTVLSKRLSDEIDRDPVAASVLRSAWILFAAGIAIAVFG